MAKNKMQLHVYDILMMIGIPSIISFIFQLVFTKVAFKVKKNKECINKELEDTILIRKALQVILRDRLRELYTKYTKRSYIDIADKDLFDSMYKIYHKLGQNGVMDGMYNKVMSLPTSQQYNSSKKQKEKEKENNQGAK